MSKFETLKNGLRNGLICSLTEEGNTECGQYGEGVDTAESYWLVFLDVESGCIANFKSTFDGKRLELDCDEDHFKPHLFPLSHLTKPIRIEGYNNGKEFVPIVEIFRLYETNQFLPKEHELRKIGFSFNESDYTVKHFVSEYGDGEDLYVEYIRKYSNTDARIMTFGYDPNLRRFHARDNTVSKPHAVAYQLDMFNLLHKWHFNVFSLPECDYIDASESGVYESK